MAITAVDIAHWDLKAPRLTRPVLRLVRKCAPLDVAPGEFAHVLADFCNLLCCVGCLRADRYDVS